MKDPEKIHTIRESDIPPSPPDIFDLAPDTAWTFQQPRVTLKNMRVVERNSGVVPSSEASREQADADNHHADAEDCGHQTKQ